MICKSLPYLTDMKKILFGSGGTILIICMVPQLWHSKLEEIYMSILVHILRSLAVLGVSYLLGVLRLSSKESNRISLDVDWSIMLDMMGGISVQTCSFKLLNE